MIRRTIGIALMASVALSLAACESAKKVMSNSKDAPDEFAAAKMGFSKAKEERRQGFLTHQAKSLPTSLTQLDTKHEREEARKAREAREAASADDGWTVVEAKRGRRKTTDDAGTAVGGIRAATADRRRNDGPKLRENFYRFQQREKRRGELYELKMRFEADKDRVAKLKASRKFRPT